MSIRPLKTEQQAALLTGRTMPNLAALFHKTVSIGGSGKRKVDGEYAATRLGNAMTGKWANERFRQVMVILTLTLTLTLTITVENARSP